MPHLDSFDHRTGNHCGAAALRNVADFYNWGYDEAECFGLGAGLVFDLVDDPATDRQVARASADWLVEAFFENLEVPHLHGEGDTWQGAWDDVADTIESDDPAILTLDADALPYLPDEDRHSFPHVAVAVGHDDESVTLSDPTVGDLQDVSFDDLEAAWTIDGLVEREFEYVTINRARTLTDDGTAAARAINQTLDYFTQATDAPRTTGRPGDEGLPALRTFAAELPDRSDDDDPSETAASLVRALDWHGDGTAFRGLYADALAELAPRAGLDGSHGQQYRDLADQWGSVIEDLRAVARGRADPDVTFEEVGSRLGDIAQREEQFFHQLDRQI